ncbi:MAG: UDP-3-O-[3-hydroxymyristoyl] N-acetylglucosamine deacetylase [Bacteroidales bacterium]|nr:UDP-3-O-[3-hydroxymyristoyl] N-acetylglucosamine deacetylase [Bacteroidales bacterium]
MKQHTLQKIYKFSGKGLHTGKITNMVLKPAPENFGIRFHRTDIGPEAIVAANAMNVTSTARSTTLEGNGAQVITTEHLLAAFMGLSVDNALVEIDNVEIPILDGSSKPYTDAISADGICEQNAERKYLEIKTPFTYEEDGRSITILPSDKYEIEVHIDFSSKVVGQQIATFTLEEGNFAKEIGCCRTFCFFHEIEFLMAHNLIKGGDIDNAIVIVEHEPASESVEKLKTLFDIHNLEVKVGYLNNLTLHYENECARHKLLDLIGDFALTGMPIKGKIIASKSGHHFNTAVAKMLLGQTINQ